MVKHIVDGRKQNRTIWGNWIKMYVRRPPNTEQDPRYTTKTVKHGGAKVMVWRSFSYNGVDSIHLIEGVMDQRVYVEIGIR